MDGYDVVLAFMVQIHHNVHHNWVDAPTLDAWCRKYGFVILEWDNAEMNKSYSRALLETSSMSQICELKYRHPLYIRAELQVFSLSNDEFRGNIQ